MILAIDSPGGTTVGGESIYEEVRKLAADKPVVAEVGTLAASAGYMIASASDHIVARKTSIVGSIGVLIQYPDVSGLMDKVGIKLEEVKSSPLKASPSPFKPTNDDERAMVRKLILDSYDWFVGIVAERRKMTRSEALALADGSIFTGRQALANESDRRGRRRERGDRLAGDQGRRRQAQGGGMEGHRTAWRLPVLESYGAQRRQRARPAGRPAATSFTKLAPIACFLTVSFPSGTLDRPFGASEKANKIILHNLTAALSRGPFS